jgi:hypothetical protein
MLLGGHGNSDETLFHNILFSRHAVCFVILAQAQQPAGTAAARASVPYTSAAPFKIAVIEEETFFNLEKGITCVVRAIEDLDRRFGPLKKRC